jgi:hypothetical protein
MLLMPELLVATALNEGVAYDAPILGFTIRLFGHVIVGFVESITTTLNEQLVCNPRAFVAVQATLLVPKGNILPDAGLHDTVVTLPVGSDPEAVNVAIAEGAPPDVCSV